MLLTFCSSASACTVNFSIVITSSILRERKKVTLVCWYFIQSMLQSILLFTVAQVFEMSNANQGNNLHKWILLFNSLGALDVKIIPILC